MIRDRFELRLRDNDRDRLIADRLASYPGNASELVRRLLYAHFTGQLADFGAGAGQTVQSVTDEREAAAAVRLMGVTFADLRE
jgi:hypothetical protein